MNIKFSGRGIAFLSHYMATNDIRYCLNGIMLRPLKADQGGGVIGVATNGSIIGLWHDAGGEIDRETILHITKPLVAALGKTTRGQYRNLVLRDNHLACTCFEGLEEHYIQPNDQKITIINPWEIEGKFPDLSRVLDSVRKVKESGGPVDAINPAYLALLHKSMPADVRRFPSITLRQPNKHGIVYALFPSITDAFAGIMPMSDEVDDAPKWLQRLMRSTDAEAATKAAPLPAMPSDAAPIPE